jgi:hypothetical protein
MVTAAVGTVQYFLLLALAIGALGMQSFALVDALRQRPAVFAAAGKLTKQIWTAILALAVVFGVLSLPVGPFSLGPLNFLNLAAVVAAGVYLADVRPALRRIAGGGSSGPYGRW